MTYDGRGRLQTKHVPEQNAGTATVYAYNTDDTMQSVTDARLATCTYGYNGRHQVTSATHTWSGQSTIALSYSYDAAGNRTSMSDSQGSTSYAYDQLSRMSSETRTITGLGAYPISYGYNLANELTSITDPTGATINYGFDGTGRLSAVTGTAFGGVTTYASGLQYRAWGGLKHLAYGNSKTADAGYNARLQASSFTISGVMSKTYDYEADGSLRFSSDSLNHHFDRSYGYDHAGRIKQAFSGAEARGEPATNDRPYKQTFNYDGFNHLTDRQSNIWSEFYSTADTYLNNHRTDWDYDASGNLLGNTDASYSYDAAGNISTVGTYEPQSTMTRTVDGDGRQVKTVESTYNESSQSWTPTTIYYVRATMLGGKVLTELNESGAKHRTFVYAGNQVLAVQEIIPFYLSQGVTWEHRDPSNATFRRTMSTGDISEYAELDPIGADAGIAPPLIVPTQPDESNDSLLPYPSFSDARHPGVTYAVDGIRVPVDYFMLQLDSAFHGSLGLAEAGARASAPRLRNYEVSSRHGRLVRDFGLNLDGAINEALEERGTLIRNWIVNDNWFVAALLPQNSRNQTDFTPEQLERFKTCLKAYNVEYRGHAFHLPGASPADDNSYFYGHTERGASWYSVSAIGDFTIRTDEHSYSVADIERTKDRFNVGYGAGYVAVGFTDPKSPYVNAIASDYGMMRLSPNEVFRLWVYELGNALSSVTRTNPNLPADAREKHGGLAEPGATLEDCVFNPK